MHIDQLLHSIDEQMSDTQLTAKLSVPESWSQGRTLFGGLSAALTYHAMKNAITKEQLLRSLNTSFIGPIQLGEEFEISIEVLRRGKNVTQILGRIIQAGQTALSSLACFGTARQSKITVNNNLQHCMPPPKNASFLPQIPKVTPQYLAQFHLAKTKGSWPFTGNKEATVQGWMRFATPPKTFSDTHLVAIIDTWPPTILQMFKLPKMASTMSWNLEFIHPHLPIANDDWCAYQAITRQASDGYAHTEANVWGAKGELIAISRQVVTVFG